MTLNRLEEMEVEAREDWPETPRIVNVVEFFVTDGDGRWFLHQRGPTCGDEVGKWDFGGGKLEHGESRFEGLLREIKEEYGAGLRIHAVRQVPGYTMFRKRDRAGLVPMEHLEIHPFFVLVDKMSINPMPMVQRGKMASYGWFQIYRSAADITKVVIDQIAAEELHSTIPFVLERYDSDFIHASSLSRWKDFHANAFKHTIDEFEETAHTRAHVVDAEGME